MAMIDHPIAPEEVQSYADGELAADRADVLRAHIADCAECAATLELVQSVSHDMAQWAVEEPPASLTVPAFRGAGTPPAIWSRGWMQAAALFVVGVGLFWMGRTSERTELGGDKAESLEVQPALMADGSMGRLESADLFSKQTGALSDRASDVSPGDTQFLESRIPDSRLGRFERPLAQTGRQGQAAPVATTPRPVMVARTVTIGLIVKNVMDGRAALDRIIEQAGGFTQHIDVSTATAQSRSLQATLRVPADKLPTVLAAIRQLGTVVSESQGGEDVTTQAVDLDARLNNARETEKRLVQVLQTRTGRVGDVLEVEREIARVRGEIEQMSAERTGLLDRVSYATVMLSAQEEQRAALNLGPLPVSARLRNAFIDGLIGASERALGVTTFVVRIAPTLLLGLVVLAWPAISVWRRARRV